MLFRLKRHNFLVVCMYQNGIVIRRKGDISSQSTDATGTARAMLERAFPQAGQQAQNTADGQGVAQNTAVPVVDGQPVYSDIALADYMAKQAAQQKFGDVPRSGAEIQQASVTKAEVQPELEHTTTAIPEENVVASEKNDGTIDTENSNRNAPDYVELSYQLQDRLFNEGYQIINTKSAETANLEWAEMGFDLPPVAANTIVYNVKAGDFSYSRVYLEGYNQPMSNFILRTSDIEGLTAKQIAQKYSLSKIPNRIVLVDLPRNISLEVSITGPQEAWGTLGGDIQYAIKDEDLHAAWFKNVQKLD